MAKRRCKPSLTRCPLRGRNCCRPRNAGHNSSSDTRHGEEQTVRSSSNFYSARQALCWLHEYNLDLPVKQTDGDTAWRRPSYSAIHRIIENPVYGGAYAYGKTAVAAGYSAEGVSVKIRRKTRSEWLALEPNNHERYVSWERVGAVRAMVRSNVPTGRHHGAPKHGDALLAGLIRCKRCGRKLTLRL